MLAWDLSGLRETQVTPENEAHELGIRAERNREELLRVHRGGLIVSCQAQ